MHGHTNVKINKNYIQTGCTKRLSKWPHKSEDSEV
jgi:hypothetical protein